MANNLAYEYQGFLKFFTRAKIELQKWFGTYSNNDPVKIAFIASREWDGMADLERKPFIKSLTANDLEKNPYMSYLLFNSYTNKHNSTNSHTFDPKMAKLNAKTWKLLSEKQKSEFSSMKTYDLGIDYVICKRDDLHKIYDPKKLNILEFILKTRPKWPASSRIWFFRSENQSLASKSAKERWDSLSEEDREVYEKCAILDRKRFDFEKKAWITNILTIDFEADDFTLTDFEIPNIRNTIDSLGSMVEISKDLPSMVGLRRPRNPFSLFIEAYRYQIRDERPEFQFGKHLRECSEAWYKLSDEERDFYKQESEKLKENRKVLLANEPKASSRLTVPVDIFKATKSVYGPCRPAHLYPKLPTAKSLWAEENSIHTSVGKKLWNELSDDIKNIYIQKRENLKEVIEDQKSEIDNKHKYVKFLIKEAVKLEDLKKELRLIGASRKAVKNLYT